MINVDPFKRWRLTPIINASGTMTSLGASRVPGEVRSLVDQILASFVSLNELQSRAGAVIARATGAEAGCVTSCSAAAMTQSVAACLTGTDLALIERLPETDRENRVILQMGHMVNYGAPVDQSIRLAGGEVVPVGTAAQCETWHLGRALRDGAAAALYVVSHHTVRENELPMDIFIDMCNAHDVPVIVDMASEYDMKGPIALGASVSIYSGHKFLSGVTSGIVAGKQDLVRAIYLQHRGIGRTMKVGKEGVVGAMAAVEIWDSADLTTVTMKEESRIDAWIDALANVPGLAISRHADWTGNPISRVRVEVKPEKAQAFAWEFTAKLSERTPRIIVRDDLVERGEFYLDPCNVTDEEADLVARAIIETANEFRIGGGLKLDWSQTKRNRESGILGWSGKDSDDIGG